MLDVSAIERRLSRASAVVGLGACAVLMAVTPDHRAPARALLAALSLYALAKLVVMALRVRERSALWLANLCELGALGTVGFVVWRAEAGPITMSLVVLLLLGAALWRRRCAQPSEPEVP